MDIQLNPCPPEAPTLEFSQIESAFNLENISYITDSSSSASIKHLCDLFDQLTSKLKIQQEDFLTIKLTELRHNIIELILLAPKYDYSSSNPGNGCRSFVKLIIQFVSRWIEKFTLNKIQYQHLSPSKKDLMVNIVNFLITLSNLFILIDSKIGNSPDCVSDISDLLNIHHSTIDPIVLRTLLSIDSATLYNFLNEFNGAFWLTSNLNLCLKIYSRLVTFYSSSNGFESKSSPNHFFKLLLNLNDEVTKANVKFALNGTVDQVKKLWSFYGKKVNYPLILASNSFKVPKIRKIIKIQRENLLKIINNKVIFNSSSTISNNSLFGSEWTLNCTQCNCNCICNEDFGKNNKIKCQQVSTSSLNDDSNEIEMLLLHDNHFGKSPNDTLVLHLHGGGFVSIKPKCHEIYLRKWSSNLHGVPIVSVDYSLSPQVKYPTALEEILEVYLYLIGFDTSQFNHDQVGEKHPLSNCKINNKVKVQDLLGFVPKNIILFGDSAGANLSLSLLHVLHDLNDLLANNSPNLYLAHKRLGEKIISYPKCLFLPYPHANVTLNKFTPSRIFLTIDPILPFGSFYSLSEAYTPDTNYKCYNNNNNINNNNNNSKNSENNHNHCFPPFPVDGDLCHCETDEKTNNNNGNNENFVTISPDSTNQKGTYTNDKFCTDGCRDCKYSTNGDTRPWYKPPEVCSFRLQQIDQLNLGKYFNPLNGSFDDFKSIPLFIQVGEFDPLLDESIAIANKWKGMFTFSLF